MMHSRTRILHSRFHIRIPEAQGTAGENSQWFPTSACWLVFFVGALSLSHLFLLFLGFGVIFVRYCGKFGRIMGTPFSDSSGLSLRMHTSLPSIRCTKSLIMNPSSKCNSQTTQDSSSLLSAWWRFLSHYFCRSSSRGTLNKDSFGAPFARL